QAAAEGDAVAGAEALGPRDRVGDPDPLPLPLPEAAGGAGEGLDMRGEAGGEAELRVAGAGAGRCRPRPAGLPVPAVENRGDAGDQQAVRRQSGDQRLNDRVGAALLVPQWVLTGLRPVGGLVAREAHDLLARVVRPLERGLARRGEKQPARGPG